MGGEPPGEQKIHEEDRSVKAKVEENEQASILLLTFILTRISVCYMKILKGGIDHGYIFDVTN